MKNRQKLLILAEQCNGTKRAIVKGLPVITALVIIPYNLC